MEYLKKMAAGQRSSGEDAQRVIDQAISEMSVLPSVNSQVGRDCAGRGFLRRG